MSASAGSVTWLLVRLTPVIRALRGWMPLETMSHPTATHDPADAQPSRLIGAALSNGPPSPPAGKGISTPAVGLPLVIWVSNSWYREVEGT